MASRAPQTWWSPSVHADRRPLLLARRRILAAIRAHFDAQGFVEVEPAALQVSPGNETHLHAFETRLERTDGSCKPLYLHTSPEFACKKLLAAGESRIYCLARVFRNRESGPLHHPEFTMLEWYRAGEPYEALMTDCADLLRVAAEAAGSTTMRWRDASADPFAAPERLAFIDAMARHAGIDLLATLDATGSGDRDALAAAAVRAGVRVAGDDTWADIVRRLVVACLDPHLGRGRATILDGYPASQSPLARPSPRDARLAQRFELYVAGVEVANAFAEQTDARLQRALLETEMAEKARIYGRRYPIDEDFLAALAAMPPASGAALGLDRLVMLATGAPSLAHIVWTPVAETDPQAPA